MSQSHPALGIHLLSQPQVSYQIVNREIVLNLDTHDGRGRGGVSNVYECRIELRERKLTWREMKLASEMMHEIIKEGLSWCGKPSECGSSSDSRVRVCSHLVEDSR